MEQNIYDILVNGLDLNAFYSFIDSKTKLSHNTPVQKGGRHATDYREKLLSQWKQFKQGKPIRIIKVKKIK